MLSIATALIVSLTTIAAQAPDSTSPMPQPAPSVQPRVEQPREGRPPGGPGGGERRASVEGAMKLMDRNFDQLQGQISDATKRSENLVLINDMQRGCVTAKGLPLPKDVLERAADEAAQAKMKETYRADMLALLKQLISLEEAVADGKLETAKTILVEVTAERDRAHQAMGVGEEKPFWKR
ncbi:MAG: hypothetical protein ACREJD_12610 [Phycisphaerales bacterium]